MAVLKLAALDTDDLQVISDEIQARFEEVGSLQLLLAQSAMPPNDFLIHGGSDERTGGARVS